MPSRERQDIEKRWQIEPVQSTENFRNEPGKLRGEAELMQDWLDLQNASVVEPAAEFA